MEEDNATACNSLSTHMTCTSLTYEGQASQRPQQDAMHISSDLEASACCSKLMLETHME